jgi:CheY-like chemotaxis protein
MLKSPMLPAKAVKRPPNHTESGVESLAAINVRKVHEKKSQCGRILVVEDSRDLADVILSVLTASMHDVRVAYDGLLGVQEAASFLPDAALIDIGLPSIDGMEVARGFALQEGGRATRGRYRVHPQRPNARNTGSPYIANATKRRMAPRTDA